MNLHISPWLISWSISLSFECISRGECTHIHISPWRICWSISSSFQYISKEEYPHMSWNVLVHSLEFLIHIYGWIYGSLGLLPKPWIHIQGGIYTNTHGVLEWCLDPFLKFLIHIWRGVYTQDLEGYLGLFPTHTHKSSKDLFAEGKLPYISYPATPGAWE